VQSHLDTNSYPSGLRVYGEDMAAISIQRDDFHGEWTYTILPHPLSFTDIGRRKTSMIR
jgi:hypothetical protein